MISRKNIFSFFAISLFFTSFCFSETRFSGMTGIKGDFFSEQGKSNFTPQLTLDAFFSGQADFSENLFLRTELSVKTDDILTDNIFEGTKSNFSVDEVSLTFRKPILKTSNYFSLFAGTYEPVGSDIFLRRQFGVTKIASRTMDNFQGLNSACVFPFYGIGGSYVLKLEEIPMAWGLYVYANRRNNADLWQLNFDLRYATVWENISVDFSAGIGLPLEKTKDDSNALIYVDTIFLHLGWNILFGNRYSPFAFLCQGGFENLPIKAGKGDNELEAKDFHLLFEPRFRTGSLNIDFTAYSLPQEKIKKTMVLDDSLGFVLNFYNDKIAFNENNMTFGVNFVLSFPEKNFMDLKDLGSAFNDNDYTFKLVPHFDFPVANGSLVTLFHLNFTNFSNNRGAEALKISLGYKKQI